MGILNFASRYSNKSIHSSFATFFRRRICVYFWDANHHNPIIRSCPFTFIHQSGEICQCCLIAMNIYEKPWWTNEIEIHRSSQFAAGSVILPTNTNKQTMFNVYLFICVLLWIAADSVLFVVIFLAFFCWSLMKLIKQQHQNSAPEHSRFHFIIINHVFYCKR